MFKIKIKINTPQYGSGPHYNHLHNAATRRKKSKKMDCYGYGKRTDTSLPQPKPSQTQIKKREQK
ncbi:MAG: hypothetical protein H0X50_08490 [Nitrosopumilus sp.]|nr:hypothetical protein [Nitrosopumilus sp.]